MDTVNADESAPSRPRDSMDSMDSTETSDLSTTSMDLDHHDSTQVDEPDPVLSTATRVVRSGSMASLEPVPDSPELARTATPRLVRSDSLRRSDSNNTMLSAGTAQGVAPDSHSSRSEEGTPKQSQSPAHSRRRVNIPDSGVGSESLMSSAWLDLEDSLAQYVLPPRISSLSADTLSCAQLHGSSRREPNRPRQHRRQHSSPLPSSRGG